MKLIPGQKTLFEAFGLELIRACEIDLMVAKGINKYAPHVDIGELQNEAYPSLADEAEQAYYFYCLGRIGYLCERDGCDSIIASIESFINKQKQLN